MTFATLSHPLCAEVGSALTVAGPRRGIFRQVIDAVADTNRRKADREIARFIQHNAAGSPMIWNALSNASFSEEGHLGVLVSRRSLDPGDRR